LRQIHDVPFGSCARGLPAGCAHLRSVLVPAENIASVLRGSGASDRHPGAEHAAFGRSQGRLR
jgi:hypothetical protein